MLSAEVLSNVPVQLLDSITCHTIVEYEDLAVVSCHTNGYMYEFKKKKIIGCAELKEQGLKISHYYFVENSETVIIYLVQTITSKIILVKKEKDYLQILQIYSNVKEFDVFDFENVGFPQIKILFSDTETEEIVNFLDPDLPDSKTSSNTLKNFHDSELTVINDALNEKLQMIYRNLVDLNEENEALIRMRKKLTKCEEPKSGELKLISTWWKAFGENFGFGLKICNTCDVDINDITLMIGHKNLKLYSYKCFTGCEGISLDSIETFDSEGVFSSQKKIYIVGAFKMPVIMFESEMSFDFYLFSSDFKINLLQGKISFSSSELATSALDLNEELRATDLMIIMTINEEVEVEIKTEGGEDCDVVESVLVEKLKFKKLKNKEINLFYCTSTVLNETLIFSKQVSTNPGKWKMRWFIRDDSQFYILVNALYDVLPDKTTILLDEN